MILSQNLKMNNDEKQIIIRSTFNNISLKIG